MKWSRHRTSFYGTEKGHSVFRIDGRNEVENPKGRFWAAVHRDGSFVLASDLGLPYEGIHRFATLRDAQWHLEVHDGG